jgi:UDP-glucuronate 4-epimerase
MTRSVLVTGAAGFIGSHLAERLVDSGYTVIGLDNFDDYYPAAIKRTNISHLKGDSRFQLINGDIRDTALLSNIFSRQRISCVFHLAARAGVRPSLEQPLLYQDINIMGTINLLQSCRNQSVENFIFASSSSVYGINKQSPFSEESSINHPISPYAASKASAELFCNTYHHLYRFPVTILRLFTVYGPRQRPEMAIHQFVRQIDSGGEVDVFGDGSSQRDYTYIDDVVDGFAAAMQYQGNSCQIFNLGGGKVVNLACLLEVIQKALNKKAHLKYTAEMPGDVPITMADISKAKNLLGYIPRVDIVEGVRRFVEWYQVNKER